MAGETELCDGDAEGCEYNCRGIWNHLGSDGDEMIQIVLCGVRFIEVVQSKELCAVMSLNSRSYV